MDIHEWPRCIKSARQKRRLVKTDRDKQLIKLDKRRNKLWEQQRLLPMVPYNTLISVDGNVFLYCGSLQNTLTNLKIYPDTVLKERTWN